MLPGFDDITEPLNEEELKLLPYFIKGLSNRIGSGNAISNSQIRQALREKKDIIISDARVRKIIAHICNKEIIEGLIATSKGYYITRNLKELDDYEKSLLGREQAIGFRRKIVHKYKQKLMGQSQQHFSF